MPISGAYTHFYDGSLLVTILEPWFIFSPKRPPKSLLGLAFLVHHLKPDSPFLFHFFCFRGVWWLVTFTSRLGFSDSTVSMDSSSLNFPELIKVITVQRLQILMSNYLSSLIKPDYRGLLILPPP